TAKPSHDVKRATTFITRTPHKTTRGRKCGSDDSGNPSRLAKPPYPHSIKIDAVLNTAVKAKYMEGEYGAISLVLSRSLSNP
ncbi:hypothetical protein GW17_00058857, partial [Ensete ventricosum]